MNQRSSGFASEILKGLEKMGASSEEVASLLKEKDIRGSRHSRGNLNPIIRYIQNNHFIHHLEICDENRLRIEFADGTEEEVRLPGAVREFLSQFHQGAHPNLELRE